MSDDLLTRARDRARRYRHGLALDVCRCPHPDGPVCGDCPDDAAVGGEVERG